MAPFHLLLISPSVAVFRYFSVYLDLHCCSCRISSEMLPSPQTLQRLWQTQGAKQTGLILVEFPCFGGILHPPPPKALMPLLSTVSFSSSSDSPLHLGPLAEFPPSNPSLLHLPTRSSNAHPPDLTPCRQRSKAAGSIPLGTNFIRAHGPIKGHLLQTDPSQSPLTPGAESIGAF